MATTAGHMFRAGPRRALPRSCRPAQDETTGSYLLRLAAVNRITGADLISYLTASQSAPVADVSLASLAIVSGHPPLSLAYALPELRAQHPGHQVMALHGRTLPCAPNTVRPACRRCAAARDGAERIDIWYRHEQNICRAHRLWTGPGADRPRDQPDLTAAPDITHAQTRHLRLIWRYGRQAVHAAYDTARIAWHTATYRGRGMPSIILRDLPLPASFGHQNWPDHTADPVHAAASYPEIVTLTSLLIKLRWQPALASSTRYDQFLTEFRHQLAVAFPALDHDVRQRIVGLILTAVTVPGSGPMPETADDTPSCDSGPCSMRQNQENPSSEPDSVRQHRTASHLT